MIIKKRAGNEFLDIKLHNNRIRRVTDIFNPDRLKEYIDALLDTKIESDLQEKQ